MALFLAMRIMNGKTSLSNVPAGLLPHVREILAGKEYTGNISE